MLFSVYEKRFHSFIHLKINNCNFSLEENAIELVRQGWDGLGWGDGDVGGSLVDGLKITGSSDLVP